LRRRPGPLLARLTKSVKGLDDGLVDDEVHCHRAFAVARADGAVTNPRSSWSKGAINELVPAAPQDAGGDRRFDPGHIVGRARSAS
jgi:hypothetical protein